MVVGSVFQMSTRLLRVSATARWVPSDATAVGVFMPVAIGVWGDVARHVGVVGVVVTGMVVGGVMQGAGKELVQVDWPSTRLAVPTHTGQSVLYCSAALGGGSWVDAFW